MKDHDDDVKKCLMALMMILKMCNGGDDDVQKCSMSMILLFKNVQCGW